MSDTPRTDAAGMDSFELASSSYPQCVNADFARELERELNALKASIGHAMKLEYKDAPPALEAGLPEDFRRIALLFTSRCTRTKMTSGEKTAWIRTGDSIKEHDFELLEWFYGLDKSADYDQTWHRKGQPAALLNNLNAQLDLAFALKESMRKSQPKLGTAPQW